MYVSRNNNITQPILLQQKINDNKQVGTRRPLRKPRKIAAKSCVSIPVVRLFFFLGLPRLFIGLMMREDSGKEAHIKEARVKTNEELEAGEVGRRRVGP